MLDYDFHLFGGEFGNRSVAVLCVEICRAGHPTFVVLVELRPIQKQSRALRQKVDIIPYTTSNLHRFIHCFLLIVPVPCDNAAHATQTGNHGTQCPGAAQQDTKDDSDALCQYVLRIRLLTFAQDVCKGRACTTNTFPFCLYLLTRFLL